MFPRGAVLAKGHSTRVPTWAKPNKEKEETWKIFAGYHFM
jgi:hypothetical protein